MGRRRTRTQHGRGRVFIGQQSETYTRQDFKYGWKNEDASSHGRICDPAFPSESFQRRRGWRTTIGHRHQHSEETRQDSVCGLEKRIAGRGQIWERSPTFTATQIGWLRTTSSDDSEKQHSFYQSTPTAACTSDSDEGTSNAAQAPRHSGGDDQVYSWVEVALITTYRCAPRPAFPFASSFPSTPVDCARSGSAASSIPLYRSPLN
jgi:hypothetical protein